MKKYVLAGLFLFGGYFVLKKFVLSNQMSELEKLELQSIDDAINKERIEDEKQKQERLRKLASQELPKLSRAGGMYTTLPISAIPLPKNSKPVKWTMTPEQLKAIQQAVDKMKKEQKI